MATLENCCGIEDLMQADFCSELKKKLLHQHYTRYSVLFDGAKFFYFCHSFAQALAVACSNLRLKGSYREVWEEDDSVCFDVGGAPMKIKKIKA